jgi:cytochrome c-type biogenesis protein CcmE
MNKAYIIGLLVISVAMGFTLWSFKDTMTPYTDIAGARKADATVQVRGAILHETAHYDDQIHALRFSIQDDKGAKIEVIYHGAKPESFDTAKETAAHGMIGKDTMGQEVFMSDSLVVKCPSKYDDNRTPYKKTASAKETI